MAAPWRPLKPGETITDFLRTAIFRELRKRGVKVKKTEVKMGRPNITYQAYYHIDGSGLEIIETGLTRAEAMDWLRSKSEELGQPLTAGGEAVNESDKPGCGYYAIDREDGE